MTVDELVEWVAQTIYNDWGCSKWERLMDREREIWIKTARKTLSHPDLTMIDSQQVRNWLAFIDNELCFGGNWDDAKGKIEGIQQLIIHLAEALKEKEDETAK